MLIFLVMVMMVMMIIVIMMMMRDESVDDLFQKIDDKESYANRRFHVWNASVIMMMVVVVIVVVVMMMMVVVVVSFFLVFMVVMAVILILIVSIVMVMVMIVIRFHGCPIDPMISTSIIVRIDQILVLDLLKVLMQVLPDFGHQVDETGGQEDSAAEEHQHLHAVLIAEPWAARVMCVLVT